MEGFIMKHHDLITPRQAHSLAGLLAARCERTPHSLACQQYDEAKQSWQSYTWQQIHDEAMLWRGALAREGLKAGDRVAIMLRNCHEWLCFDMAALGLGLVTVPLYPNDRADSAAYIVDHSGSKLLLVETLDEQDALLEHIEIQTLKQIVCLRETTTRAMPTNAVLLTDWLARADRPRRVSDNIDPDSLATIVYTSGTTGPPKGVMLSHHNILWNAWSGLHSVDVYHDDVFLSFLPLSHTLERTVGYYLPIMAGAAICYARSIPQLAEDLVDRKPTVLISVPRIYERIYNRIHEQLSGKSAVAQTLFNTAVDIGWAQFEHQQGRQSWSPKLLLHGLLDKLVGHKIRQRVGGRLRIAICGGAPLPEHVAKTFIALGFPIQQGYGLTETSPVISVNTVKQNLPRSVGQLLKDVIVDVTEQSELIVKSPGLMLGYWRNQEATATTIDADGWLHTGDLARLDEHGFLHITGRLKDIIVLANGEKVSPVDMETAIAADKLIDQALVVGDGRPFLSALLVLSDEAWLQLATLTGLKEPAELSSAPAVEQHLLGRIQQQLHQFPSYAQVIRIAISQQPWTIENGLSTPTLKAKRQQIMTLFAKDIDRLYEGH
jgi:long-chain acyl-CoA synthetase